MNAVSEIFGSMVFNANVMKERLPRDTYQAMQKTIKDGYLLNLEVATIVANAMKDWAIEKGATHYTHWFQPMTGVTAEKHDSFISPTSSGRVIMEFSGKELVQGEPDASSFPSGGLRATFEARGYTAWDPTSYAFIKGKTLYIPTAFCSYGGEALDKKTPLLRSLQALNIQALRVLRLFGNDTVTYVRTNVGPEQEYFLVDKELYEKRRDLKHTGRTLFGAAPPKGQEMDDHYFGSIKPRVKKFMEELDVELWKLGVLAKTEHNEAAPGQHELAPVFSTANISTDHNQLTMEVMQTVAKRHGLVCLLHEKPFAGLNGSGKHNNWSLSTNTGMNLFEPGDTPFENAQFLLFLCAVIKAVDDYQELLRLSVATAGNDHRLGANEAPPAVVSIFLGDELTEILSAIECDCGYDCRQREQMQIGVDVLPYFPKDTTDRNRTSPMAFTGNKFEFRMPGSSLSIAGPNFVMNTAVAEVLRQFADELEGGEDFTRALHDLIQRTICNHKRIIFNGNGYDDAWLEEASERGLLNLKTTPDALPLFLSRKSISLFASHGVLTETEIQSRYEIVMENYTKVINIEALTMLDIVKKEILPSVAAYSRSLAEGLNAKKAALPSLSCTYETETLKSLSRCLDDLYEKTGVLEKALSDARDIYDVTELAIYCRDEIIPVMGDVRITADELETFTAKNFWPFPTYDELLFGL